MRIVHIAPNSPYNDNWGYQENLLPRYQRKLGHEVTLLIPNLTHGEDGLEETACSRYTLGDGVQVIRLKRKNFGIHVISNTASWLPVYPLLQELQPDLIFFHGLISLSIWDAVKYKRHHPGCVLVQDNHMDDNIGKQAHTLKERFFRSYYRLLNRYSVPYVDRIYGVTPWRKQYAETYFRIPHEKTDVLMLGADDDRIDFANRSRIRENIRKQYNIQPDDFLIVTGGKLDAKKKTLVLMQACSAIQEVKLLIFGKVDAAIQENFECHLTRSQNIIFAGWIPSERVYDYFFAADLVFFPGQHSVLWEQACAAKVPCVFEAWEGMAHVNNGGNADFVTPVNVETVSGKIRELCRTAKYERMKQTAQSEKTDVYRYSHIAVKSLECVQNRTYFR